MWSRLWRDRMAGCYTMSNPRIFGQSENWQRRYPTSSANNVGAKLFKFTNIFWNQATFLVVCLLILAIY